MEVSKVRKISARIEKFTKGVAWVSFVCVVAMMLINVVDVILDRGFGTHVLGAYEITQRLLMCAVFTSFAYGQSRKTHINMTILIAKFPRALRYVLFTLMSLLSIFAAGAMTWAAYTQTQIAYTKNYLTEVLYIPLFPFYIVETVAMAIFTLAIVYDTILYIIAIRRDDYAEMIQENWS